MYSQTEICNMALDNFGCGRITSLDEDTETANLCRNNYENCRQSLLAKGCWNFATGYIQLNEVEDKGLYHPVFEHFYLYPQSVIKIVQIFSCPVDFVDRYAYSDFEVMSYGDKKYIACHFSGAKAKVINDITNTAIFSPEFTTCLSFYLSSRISEALTRNGQVVQEMEAKYQASLQQAMLTSAVEGQKKTQYPDFFTRFRNSEGVGVKPWHHR